MDNMNTRIVNKLQEIIEFFELEEGYDKDEIIRDILFEIKELKGNYSDEIILMWDEEELMVLCDFIDRFYSKIIEKMCNVIKSYQKEL